MPGLSETARGAVQHPEPLQTCRPEARISGAAEPQQRKHGVAYQLITKGQGLAPFRERLRQAPEHGPVAAAHAAALAQHGALQRRHHLRGPWLRPAARAAACPRRRADQDHPAWPLVPTRSAGFSLLASAHGTSLQALGSTLHQARIWKACLTLCISCVMAASRACTSTGSGMPAGLPSYALSGPCASAAAAAPPASSLPCSGACTGRWPAWLWWAGCRDQTIALQCSATALVQLLVRQGGSEALSGAGSSCLALKPVTMQRWEGLQLLACSSCTSTLAGPACVL